MSFSANLVMARELSSIVLQATKGPHTRATAREILTRIRIAHEKADQSSMEQTVQFVVRILKKNMGLIPEVQSFILILEHEYKVGIEYGKYN